MGVVAIVGERDGGVVPAPPVAGLVSGDQQDRSPYRIEGEQDAYFAGSGGAWPGSVNRQAVDRVFDKVGGARIVLGQVAEPFGDLLDQQDLPVAHAPMLT